MSEGLLDTALAYGALGWKIMPCHGFDSKMSCTCGVGHPEPRDAGKHAAISQWNVFASDDSEDIKKWWTKNGDYNPALYCLKTGFFVIDIDPRSGGDQSFEKLTQILDEKGINLPITVEAVTGTYNVSGKAVRGRHIYFQCGTGENLVGTLKMLDLPGIDIKYNGYVMLPGSKHFSGTVYEWVEGRDPWSIPVAPAPEGILSLLRKRSGATTRSKTDSVNWDEIEEQAEKLDLNKVLKEGLKEGERNVQAYRIAVVMTYRFSGPSGEVDEALEQLIVATMLRYNATKIEPPLPEEGPGGLIYQTTRAINFVRDTPQSMYANQDFMDWVDRQKIIQLNPEEVRQILGEVSSSESITSQHTRLVIQKALDAGKSIQEAAGRDNVDIPTDPDAVALVDGGVPGRRSLSDLGNARRMVDTYGSGMAYTPDLGFKVWSEGYWKTDKEGLHIQEMAKRLPSLIGAETAESDDPQRIEKWKAVTRSNARLKSAIDSAKSDPRIHVELEQWDKDPDLFGARNGVVSLRTGEIVAGGPSLRISMKTDIQYIPGYRNQKWQDFLDEATGGDKEYQTYLQRAAGYSITGRSNLDKLFLVYGPPGTGKNTFLETIVRAAGEYSWPLDMSVITATNGGMSGNSDMYHIAELFNKRISWIDELPEGERLKENTLKKLSGSSLMSARSPGGRPFSFHLVAKIWISTNHRPPITDDAMWRRLAAFPFVHSPKNVDPHLKEYLSDPEGGLPAVLSWMIEGAMDYLNNPAPGSDPLGYSRVVYESTEMYKNSEDRIGLFIKEELQEKPGVSIPVSSAFTSYQRWTMEQGERYLTQPAFQKKLSEKRIVVSGTGRTAEIQGYVLKGWSGSVSAAGATKLYPDTMGITRETI